MWNKIKATLNNGAFYRHKGEVIASVLAVCSLLFFFIPQFTKIGTPALGRMACALCVFTIPFIAFVTVSKRYKLIVGGGIGIIIVLNILLFIFA